MDYEDPIQRWLLELLEFYTLPGEAEQAFPGWWDELSKILKSKELSCTEENTSTST